ncbi:MAG TPA: fumarylacetoacetate hydrolase family protein [Arenicellales bacterium]|nr:fumarylacetoacetate hydrolase family protein [Arenicellales bacterium]
MKIATCRYQDHSHLAIIEDDTALLPGLVSDDAALVGSLAFIDDFERGRDLIEGLSPADREKATLPLDRIELLAPIPRPAKNIMCLGLNYADHVAETSAAAERDSKLPEHPIVFTKNVTSVTGPGSAIPFNPAASEQLDWEVELAVIIGRSGYAIDPGQAMEHVFGYTIINDVSARDLQFRHKQFFIGKSLDGACPMGPWIVTADEIADPHALSLRCDVNGVTKQESSTRHMIFDIPTIIATLSRGMTLEAGDIIATGTPDGVGFARTPPEFLKPGDEVVCEIEGIGVLRNGVGG